MTSLNNINNLTDSKILSSTMYICVCVWNVCTFLLTNIIFGCSSYEKCFRLRALILIGWDRSPDSSPLPHIIRKLSTSASSRKHPHLFTLTCGRSERLWIMKMNESLHAFDFERQFNDRAALEWFEQNWWVELSESNYWFNSITADERLLSCTIQ